MRPELNWFGWSTETIAAVYETNAAIEDDNEAYFFSAAQAEMYEHEKDVLCKRQA